MVTPAPLTLLPLTTPTTIPTTNTNSMSSYRHIVKKMNLTGVARTSIESPQSSPQQSIHDSADSSLRIISSFRIPKVVK